MQNFKKIFKFWKKLWKLLLIPCFFIFNWEINKIDKILFYYCNPFNVKENMCVLSSFKSKKVLILAMSYKIETEASLLFNNLLSLLIIFVSRIIKRRVLFNSFKWFEVLIIKIEAQIFSQENNFRSG